MLKGDKVILITLIVGLVLWIGLVIYCLISSSKEKGLFSRFTPPVDDKLYWYPYSASNSLTGTASDTAKQARLTAAAQSLAWGLRS
jgi:hypothetical protein